MKVLKTVFEKLDKSFHEKLRQGFLTIARESPVRVKVIDASIDPDNVFAQIKIHLQEKMEKVGRNVI